MRGTILFWNKLNKKKFEKSIYNYVVATRTASECYINIFIEISGKFGLVYVVICNFRL